MVAVKDWRSGIAVKDEQQLLQRRILFRPGEPSMAASSKMHTLQLEPLNELFPYDFTVRGRADAASTQDCAKEGYAVKVKRVLEDSDLEEESWLVWDGPTRIGAGLQNLGNTCFLNSVLQCMTYTPPLARYLRSGNHKISCNVTGFCAVCALETHVKQALSSTDKVISPQFLVKNLRCISRAFQPWRQEDAHEYMRYLVEALHKCLSNSSKNSSTINQSLVHKIFGGRLRSQVKCSNCLYCSDTFDPFLDLSLEIVNADSLPRALAHFTRNEIIDGDNKYRCEKCKQKVRATKCFTIEKAPNILTIQFKRFMNSGRFGGKINKKVDFGQTLDLSPYLSKRQEVCKYKLYAVLVHSGGSMHSGHYYCFVRTLTDSWHVLDDSRVKPVSERTILEQKAYMLFYVRESISKKSPVNFPRKISATLSASVAETAPSNVVRTNGHTQITCSPETNGNLDSSLAGGQNVLAKQSNDLPKLVNIESVEPKDVVTDFESSQASSVRETTAKPDREMKNEFVGEYGANVADNVQKKSVTDQAIERDCSMSSTNTSAIEEPSSSTPSNAIILSLQQQEKSISGKTNMSQHCLNDGRVEQVSRTKLKSTISYKEHVEGGKILRKGSVKKKSIQSSQRYHLKLLQVFQSIVHPVPKKN